MYFEQIVAEGLGCFSYVIGCPAAGEMCVVDPRRDVQVYLDIARERGMKLTRVIDTHLHADHVSGAHELAYASGAVLCMYHSTPVEFPFTPLREGDTFSMGVARVTALRTPGHTPDALSLLVADTARSEEPWLLLSGDLLFVGDVGRPDLAGSEHLEDQVQNLHASIYQTLGQLPGHLALFPAHGAGSLCGRGMSPLRSSTLGFERLANPMLQLPDFAAFRKAVTTALPARPKSFSRIIAINRHGAPLLDRCPLDKALNPDRFAILREAGATVIDTRDAAAFGGAHIPGSLNIGFEPSVANWTGMVVDPDAALLLVVASRERYEAMRTELHRIGYDNILGWLAGGISGWIAGGRPVDRLTQTSAAEVRLLLDRGPAPRLVDVRTTQEWESGRIPGAMHRPIADIVTAGLDLRGDEPVVLYCGSGYRSNIAASLLSRKGFADVRSLAGGITAWRSAGYPMQKDA
jgi:rhodanese-related sulfurtransferase/glyoxylase-like metal-dependent hydrolase (beta-lactamase superfamily II)